MSFDGVSGYNSMSSTNTGQEKWVFKVMALEAEPAVFKNPSPYGSRKSKAWQHSNGDSLSE